MERLFALEYSHHPELVSHGQQFVGGNKRGPAYVDSLSALDLRRRDNSWIRLSCLS